MGDTVQDIYWKLFHFYKFSCATMQTYEVPPLRPLHILTDCGGSEWQGHSWTAVVRDSSAVRGSDAKFCSSKRSLKAWFLLIPYRITYNNTLIHVTTAPFQIHPSLSSSQESTIIWTEILSPITQILPLYFFPKHLMVSSEKIKSLTVQDSTDYRAFLHSLEIGTVAF